MMGISAIVPMVSLFTWGCRKVCHAGSISVTTAGCATLANQGLKFEARVDHVPRIHVQGRAVQAVALW